MNIAIMGATSHIAKGLIDRFLQSGKDHLYLFSRSAGKIQNFLAAINASANENYTICTNYQTFSSFSYDVIINCVGVGTLNKLRRNFRLYFSVTEEFDNMAIAYLCNSCRNALYISLSSGAVYGRKFSTSAQEGSVNRLQVNHVIQEDYYGIVRINAEAKHRAHCDLRIIDLRIFSYFSRYIDLTDGYFITDVLEAILSNKVLVTNNTNIVRDYLHPEDLFAMVVKCIHARKLNQACDVNSSVPVTKQEIIEYFASEYGLKYKKLNFSEDVSATGEKSNYYSTSNFASKIGYIPQFSSMDTIKDEAKYILPDNSTILKESLNKK